MTDDTTFLKCTACGEYLHVICEPVTSEKTGKLLKKKNHSLECPACGKNYNIKLQS